MSMPTCPSCIYAQGICEKTGVKIRYSTGCTYHTPKPITNADRIRAKSDDEMASWLALHPCLPNCPAQTDECFKSSKLENCKKQWLDWLKQEATNDP